AAYRQRFSRAHAATTPAQSANKGTVALTANAVMRASVLKLAIGASAAPASVPGLMTRPSLLAGFIPTAVATGDLNGDGFTDWVVANGGDDSLWIYYGHGDGTADNPVIVPLNAAGPVAVAVAVISPTGLNDIIVAE